VKVKTWEKQEERGGFGDLKPNKGEIMDMSNWYWFDLMVGRKWSGGLPYL